MYRLKSKVELMNRSISIAMALGFVLMVLFLASGDVSTTVAASAGPSATVTFSKDVAPILYKNCVTCHRPGEVAPMSLLTYKDARPWAKSIREKVASGAMPPWHADPRYGEFSNDRRLARKDIDTISAWVEGGAKEGDPKDAPPSPRFTEGWQMGKPDVVLQMAQEFEVPAEGTISYKYFFIPTGFREDRWVQAAEIRPGNRTVVHHVIAFIADPDALREGLAARNKIEGLAGYAPGDNATVLPEGVGRLVKAGWVMVLQVHYTTNGSVQKDRSSIGLIFSKKPVGKAGMGGAAMNRRFEIPAGDSNYAVESVYRFK